MSNRQLAPAGSTAGGANSGQDGAASTANPITEEEVVGYREQDRFLPINNIQRLMKRSLPDSSKISKDAKECIQECTSEFISFITSEAGDKAAAEKRKTITGDDVLTALKSLGFDELADVLFIYLAKYRTLMRNEPARKRQKKDKKSEGGEGGGNADGEAGSAGGPDEDDEDEEEPDGENDDEEENEEDDGNQEDQSEAKYALDYEDEEGKRSRDGKDHEDGGSPLY